MTVIRPNSISGVTSITAQGGGLNIFRSNGAAGDLTINNIVGGAATFTGVLSYEDVTNVDSVGLITARGGIRIGGGTTVGPISGIVTYFGDGSQLTGISAGPTLSSGSNDRVITATGANALLGEANLTFSGSVLNINGTSDDTPLMIDTASNNGAHLRFRKDGSNQHFVGSGGGFSLGDKEDLSFRAYDNLLFATGNSSTERMRISSEGYVTKPNQPAFHAYGNNSWTQYTGSDNLIKLLNSECNIGGHYKQSGSDEGKFVVPVNGTYYFYTTIYSGRTDNGQTDNNDYLAIYFYEDGNNLANKGGHHIRHYYNEGDRDSTSSMSYIRTCTAGEKFYVSVTCNGTGYQVYGGHSAFGGYLIG